MKGSASFFLLSIIALVLWISPGGRVLLTVQEMGRVMEIEGFALFFCFMYCGFLGGPLGQTHASEARPIWVMPVLFIVGFGFGGIVAWEVGGRGLLTMYELTLLMHVIGTIKLRPHELRTESGVNFLAVLGFVALGILALKLPLPRFGNTYPPVFEDRWAFRIGGHQVLAWACAHFALLGYLHLKKHRMFVHLREETEQQSQGQTPR